MSSDSKLVRQLKENSASAFKEVYYKYYKLVYFQAFSILNNKEDAEDVMQNTFIKFMNNIKYLQEDSSLKQYLSMISKNEAIDLYRKKVSRKEVFDENILINLKEETKNDECSLIITLNNTLKKQEALIVTYKIVYDYTFNEIANDLKLPLGTVLTKYRKAIKTLKKYYQGGEN